MDPGSAQKKKEPDPGHGHIFKKNCQPIFPLFQLNLDEPFSSLDLGFESKRLFFQFWWFCIFLRIRIQETKMFRI